MLFLPLVRADIYIIYIYFSDLLCIEHLQDGQVWFATIPRAPGFAHAPEEDLKSFLLHKFGGWHDPIHEVVEGTDASNIIYEDAYAHTHFDGFSTGSCTLIGDAAHTVRV